MRILNINGKEYEFEFTFAAAEHGELVQKMFNVLTGAYIIKAGAKSQSDAMIDGVSNMVADIPHICNTAFYAGLLENNEVDVVTAKKLMHSYMKENGKSFSSMFEELKTYMEEDGFFDLSGLTEMIQKMSQSAEEVIKPKKSRTK